MDESLLFRSFSDSGRRQVLRLLGEAPLTVGEITEILGLPQSTVSRHLKTLRNTGLLMDRREGSRVYIGLIEPNGNGDKELADLLNSWIRSRPLETRLGNRLAQVIRAREGGEDSFERLAHQWDDLRFRHFGGVFHLEALCGLLPKEWEVLDMGTGTGYLLPTLSRQFRRVLAVDPSAAMLNLARQRAKREGLDNVEFRAGRLEAIPAADESVDAILALLVFRHSLDPDGSLAEIARVLKGGGRALIVDLEPHDLTSFREAMREVVPGIDPRSLASQMAQAKLDNVRWKRVISTGRDSRLGPDLPAPELFVMTAEKPLSTGIS